MDAIGSGSAGYPTTETRNAGTTLTDAAVRKLWATPTARDWKDGAYAEASDGTKGAGEGTARAGGMSLTTASLPAPAGSPSGMVLNPRFVEAMMGLPDGWTDCGCWAMASARSKPPTR